MPITTGETFYEFDGDDTCLGTRPDGKIQSCLTSMTCSELVTIPGWQYNRLPSSGQLSGGASPYGALDMAGNVAEWAAEETGSIIETQDALGHKNPSTTKAYVQRIAVKKVGTAR